MLHVSKGSFVFSCLLIIKISSLILLFSLLILLFSLLISLMFLLLMFGSMILGKKSWSLLMLFFGVEILLLLLSLLFVLLFKELSLIGIIGKLNVWWEEFWEISRKFGFFIGFWSWDLLLKCFFEDFFKFSFELFKGISFSFWFSIWEFFSKLLFLLDLLLFLSLKLLFFLLHYFYYY